MRMILVAGAALALSACGGGGSEANQANSAALDNMTFDQNLMMDQGLGGDANMAMNGAAGMGNAMDPNTQNMMRQDATTNDPDTNLANGL